MRKVRYFTGIMLVGIGILFFLDQMNIVILKQSNDWTLLLGITGLSLLGEAYFGKNYEVIIPGVVLFGVGVHLNVVNKLVFWPNNIGVFFLILAAAFLLRYQRTRDNLWPGLLFLFVAVILLFYSQIVSLLPGFEKSFIFIWKFWPLVFVVLGCYVLFVKRK